MFSSRVPCIFCKNLTICKKTLKLESWKYLNVIGRNKQVIFLQISVFFIFWSSELKRKIFLWIVLILKLISFLSRLQGLLGYLGKNIILKNSKKLILMKNTCRSLQISFLFQEVFTILADCVSLSDCPFTN